MLSSLQYQYPVTSDITDIFREPLSTNLVPYISIICRHCGHPILKLQVSVIDAGIFHRELQMKCVKLHRFEGKA